MLYIWILFCLMLGEYNEPFLLRVVVYLNIITLGVVHGDDIKKGF